MTPAPAATWTMASVAGVPGGVGLFHLDGDVDAALAAMRIAPVGIGRVAVRDIGGIDRGVVARWSAHCAHVLPHGGVVVMRAIAAAMTAAGIARASSLDARRLYPEAADEVEAQMLAALARAASPLAVDLLLDQPRRWRDKAEADPGLEARSRVLNRLIDPPLVVGVGPANVGKSTLVNELAGRTVAVVADEAGTTRDHVGVTLDLGGLVVRYVDTPGLRAEAGPIEREAVDAALAVAASADAVLVFSDATACLIDAPSHPNILRVGLRADLGRAASAVDVTVSVREGRGVEELVERVRGALIPRSAIEHPGRWRFWT